MLEINEMHYKPIVIAYAYNNYVIYILSISPNFGGVNNEEKKFHFFCTEVWSD